MKLTYTGSLHTSLSLIGTLGVSPIPYRFRDIDAFRLSGIVVNAMAFGPRTLKYCSIILSVPY